jgi:hypothetical protein
LKGRTPNSITGPSLPIEPWDFRHSGWAPSLFQGEDEVNCSGLCCRASFRALDAKDSCKRAHPSRGAFNRMLPVHSAGISVFISRPTANIHLVACACNAPAQVFSDHRGGASSTPSENMSMSGSDDPKSRREGANRNLQKPREHALRRLTPQRKGLLRPQNRSRSRSRYLSTWKRNSGLGPLSCGRTGRELALRRGNSHDHWCYA